MARKITTPADWPALAQGVEDGIKWVTAQAPVYDAVNGYVEVPEGHPWYGKEYDDIDVECPGGLTYSEGGWIGFDTLHSTDYWPGQQRPPRPGEKHWTPQMVAEATRQLAREVAKAGISDADTEPRNDSDTCECGNRKSEHTDFCRACAVADEREE